MDQGRKRVGANPRPHQFTQPEALDWHRARVLDAARLLNRSRERDPALVEAVCSRIREYDREAEAQARTVSDRTLRRQAKRATTTED